MSFELECLKNKVYHAAKIGMPMALCEHLKNLGHVDINILLSQVYEEDGQKCSPLLIAARKGHEKAVRVLLKYQPDIEQEGTVKFDGYVIDGASPLWCAAGAGHLNVVKMLVRAGADVNHPTKTNSTPLRAACFDGRLDIVQYLTSHEANIHIANKYNNTCLMIASYKGHVDIVQFLLDLGANTDEKAHCGATALHFAAECGHVAIVKELIEKGASICTNEHGMTPFTAAAERTRVNVVEYFLSLPSTTEKEKIDAYELLGASFACDRDNYSIELAYKYLMIGMKERYVDQGNVLAKPKSPRILAYNNHVECKNVEELEAIHHSTQDLHMESLVIRERILGIHNPEVPHPVIYRGAVFADNARFDRCLQLWIHALRLKQSNNVCVVKDLLRFAQVFSQMLSIGVHLEFNDVEEVLSSTVIELERTYGKTKKINPKDDIETIRDEVECNMVTSLYLIMICIRVLKDMKGPSTVRPIIEFSIGADQPSRLDRPSNADDGEEQSEEFKQKELGIHRLVYNLLQIGARNRSGKTLLHLSVNPDTPVDDFHTNDVCKFPCASTTKLLISCGANVNEMDHNRNTPLHLIVPYQKHISDFLTLHNIIIALIDAGAHMDTVNQSGETPMEAATTGVAEIILRIQNRISLQCQAARVIKRRNIPYKGHVPVALEQFIELHGPCHVDSLITVTEKESIRKSEL